MGDTILIGIPDYANIGGVTTVAAGNSGIVVGGTPAVPTISLNPASPLLPEVVAGTNITSVVQTFDGIDGHAIYTVNAAGGGGGGTVTSVTSGNSAIVIGGTATDPTVSLAPASPLLPEVVAGTNITSVVQTFDGIDGHAIYTVNAAGGGGGGTVTSVTSGNSAIVIGGTATDPTVAIAPASPLLPEVVAGTNIVSVVQTFDGIDGHAIYTVNGPAPGTGTVTSVTAGNASITIGGTAVAPTVEVGAGYLTAGDASIVVGGTPTARTVAVAPNFVTTPALSGILVAGGPTGPYSLTLDPVNFPSLAFWAEGTSVVAGRELSSWTPINAAADADIALLPKGVGGISMRNYATSTTVGGFALGAQSVDLQATSAGGNTGYVSGANSGVFVGIQGIVTGARSAIVGGGTTLPGEGIQVLADQCAAIAGTSHLINVGSINSAVLGGITNVIGDAGVGNNQRSAIAGGSINSISSGTALGTDNFIGGGDNNTIGNSGVNIAGVGCVITGGTLNAARGIGSAIYSGSNNDALGTRSICVGGANNASVGIDTIIVGGEANQVTGSATRSVVVGGITNTIDGVDGVIAGGTLNSIAVAVLYGFVGGGNTQVGTGTNGIANIASLGGSHTKNSCSNSIMTGAFGATKSCTALEDGNKVQIAGGSASSPELITVLGRNKNGQGAIVTSALHSSQHSTSAFYMEWDDASLTVAGLKRKSLSDRETKRAMVGYMVTVDKNGFIAKANSFKDVVGVTVSGDDGIVGGGHELCYKNKYQRDDFGTIITEPSYIESICDLLSQKSYGSIVLDQTQLVDLQFDSPKEICSKLELQLQPENVKELLAIEFEPRQVALLNPSFDANLPYTARSGRVEWSAVAHTGSAVVRDDGSCIVGRRCVPKNGIATSSASDDGYRVVSRLGNNTVVILF